MACRKVQPLVWMMVVAVAAIMVAENGKMCLATFDMGGAKDSVMNTAEKAKESSESWASWAYAKISGKLSVNPKDVKQGAEDMMHTSTDTTGYATGKVHAVSHASKKDDNEKFYDEAKKDVGAAYASLAHKIIKED
ncbi:hypothetical protein BVRB_6g128860 isoform B [Beta vulgaris subsp. vulgaris]|uniref:uncharacterized protein LOC104895034 isoform X2 n=1 Tax=Beta vulgaris subsp. vulgaris TaxID=3555 RepID=UPI0005402227|nr:uncharacterized protein LOC104895034 isoform X2 [Beta vulgaris subsp. vulgaris]KMT09411.1 hypothetical protein BVRB_6g128860 isoform B [Beta vulgaris subsp. vulgaris]